MCTCLMHERVLLIVLSPNNLKLLPSGLALVFALKKCAYYAQNYAGIGFMPACESFTLL